VEAIKDCWLVAPCGNRTLEHIQNDPERETHFMNIYEYIYIYGYILTDIHNIIYITIYIYIRAAAPLPPTPEEIYLIGWNEFSFINVFFSFGGMLIL